MKTTYKNQDLEDAEIFEAATKDGQKTLIRILEGTLEGETLIDMAVHERGENGKWIGATEFIRFNAEKLGPLIEALQSVEKMIGSRNG